ncbi:hypothetical protein SELMODRAFT_428828 [Selaginella moellendorffii]|uniref:Uncharacterized protein n=1 Tax=Selaginella moellendorffii TaxID=88036 RepID=D8T450_SELML|nr:hypothetical protein SELMODRAFT_428828 [Selaginella moellendorffii]
MLLVQKATGPLNKLVRNINGEEPETINVATQAAIALAALFMSIREHGNVKDAAVDAITQLDSKMCRLIDPVTQIPREGNQAGRDNTAAALAQLFAVHSICVL